MVPLLLHAPRGDLLSESALLSSNCVWQLSVPGNDDDEIACCCCFLMLGLCLSFVPFCEGSAGASVLHGVPCPERNEALRHCIVSSSNVACFGVQVWHVAVAGKLPELCSLLSASAMNGPSCACPGGLCIHLGNTHPFRHILYGQDNQEHTSAMWWVGDMLSVQLTAVITLAAACPKHHCCACRRC